MRGSRLTSLSRLDANLAVGLLQQTRTAGSASLRADVVRHCNRPRLLPTGAPFWAREIQPSCSEIAVNLFMLVHAEVAAWQSVVELVVQSTEGGSEGSSVSPEADQY